MYFEVSPDPSFTNAQLIEEIGKCPEDATELGLLYLSLSDKKTIGELAALFAAIPPTITKLSLAYSRLGAEANAKLIAILILTALPATVKALYLLARACP